MSDPLWAPWRMDFIESIDDTQGCFLCAGAEADPDADGSLLICRQGRALAMLNRFPYSNGHVLVAPLAHKARLEDLDDEELLAVFSLVRDMKRCLREAVKVQGFNVGMNIGRVAGAGLPDHLHVHVVPRWQGDTNFMPIIGNAKVIPQALRESRARLKAAWQRLSQKGQSA